MSIWSPRVRSQRVMHLLVLVVVLSFVSACGDAATGDRDQGTRAGQTQPTPSTALARAAMSTSDFTRALEASCRTFIAADPIVIDSSSNRALAEFARRRHDAIAESLRTLRALSPPASGRAMVARVVQSLEVAQTVIVPLEGQPPTLDVPDRTAIAAANRSQTELGNIAVELTAFGIRQCIPPVLAPPVDSPAEAGPLVEVVPQSVVPMESPVADPRDVAVDGSAVIVGQLRVHELVRVDATSSAVVARQAMASGGPRGIAAAGGSVWAGGDDRIERFDATTLRPLGSILHADLGMPSELVSLGISDDGSLLWVCGRGKIVVLDVRDVPIVITQRSLPGQCGGVRSGSAGEVVYTVNQQTGELFFANARTLETRLSLPQLNPVHNLAADGGYVIAYVGPYVHVLDWKTGREVRRILNRSAGVPGPVVDGVLWATVEAEWRVIRYDIATGQLREFVAGPGAHGIVMVNGNLWVAMSDAANISSFDVTPWAGES